MASKRTREKVSTAPVEIVRSFAFKLNCANYPGGAPYESADFFCSAKTVTLPSDMERASDAAYVFARKEVLKAANAHILALRDGTWKQQLDTHPVAKTNAAAYERSRTAPRNHAAVSNGAEVSNG